MEVPIDKFKDKEQEGEESESEDRDNSDLEDSKGGFPDAESETEVEEYFEDEQDLSNIIENTGTQPIRRTEPSNPFLDSEPIESLEEGLESIPARTQSQNQEQQGQPTYSTINSPNYSSANQGSYENVNYDNNNSTREINPNVDVTGSSMRMNEPVDTGDSRIDFTRWKSSNIEQPPQGQQDKYEVGRIGNADERSRAPFQRKKRF